MIIQPIILLYENVSQREATQICRLSFNLVSFQIRYGLRNKCSPLLLSLNISKRILYSRDCPLQHYGPDRFCFEQLSCFCRIFSSILGLHPLDASDSSLCHQAIKKVFRHFQKSCLAEFQSLNTERFLVSFCNSIVLHFVNVPQFIQAVPYSKVNSLSLIKRVLQRMVSCPHHFVFLVEFLKQDHLGNG